MPKTKDRIPSYRRHKPTRQAVVTIAGKDIYLGKWNTPESRQEYRRIIAEFTAHNGTPPRATADLTVAELLAAFLRHAEQYYVRPDGSRTSEVANYKMAMRCWNQLYGQTRIADFGPIALKTVRQAMVDDGLCRGTVNHCVNRIRHIVKWGVENELVSATNLHALQAVAGLRFGRSDATEAEPVKPVPDAFVDATLSYVSAQVKAMVELQRLTGMRSGEVTIMRGTDINMAGKVWIYTPATHKTAYRGHVRQVYFGPQAQTIIRPFLKTDLMAYLFSPREAMQAVRQRRHNERTTPEVCGNTIGSNRKRQPLKQPREHYDTDSYGRSIRYGIERANNARLKEAHASGIDADKVELIPNWHPHQLRHNAATFLRREHGIEVARIILGHRSPAITEVYAEVDHARAINVMAEVG